MNRAWRVSIVAAVMVAGAGVLRPASAQTIIGGALTPELTGNIGERFTIPIAVDMTGAPGMKLGAYHFKLQWNPAKFSYVSTTAGTYAQPAVHVDSAVSQGYIRVAGVNPIGANGVVTLANVTLEIAATAADTFRTSFSELSAATTFQNLLPFLVVTDGSFCGSDVWGDMDRNGQVQAVDAQIVLMHSVGMAVADTARGDVAVDNKVDPRDALIILSYVAGLDVTAYRVGQTVATSCAQGDPVSVNVFPSAMTLAPGDTFRLVAQGRDSVGNLQGVKGLGWGTNDTAVARVSPLGLVTAMGTGTATVTAAIAPGLMGTTVVTVGPRRTFWVDAAATQAENQVGSPTYPFSSIQRAVNRAQANDTIRVRSGTYREAVIAGKSLVMIGDTVGSKPRPILSFPTRFSTALTASSPAKRLELRHFELDTLYQGIITIGVDTVVLHNVLARASAGASWVLQVDSSTVLSIERSSFFGKQSSGNGVWLSRYAGLVRIDSTLFADFGSTGVYLYGADSVHVSKSTFRDVYYALDVTGGTFPTALVLSRNRFTRTQCVSLSVSGYRSIWLDHNVILEVGGCSALNIFNSPNTGLIRLRGDSISSANFSYWLNLSGYDSLAIDSVDVRVGGGYGYAYDGRTLTIKNSTFRDIRNQALYVYHSGTDTTRVDLSRVALLGGDSILCVQCGDGLDINRGNVTIDSVTATNLYSAINTWQGPLVVRRSTFTGNRFDIENDCGSTVVDSVTSVRAQSYAVYGYGCIPGDSTVVTNSTFTQPENYAVFAINGRARIQNNVVNAPSYIGIYADADTATITLNQISLPGSHGIYWYGTDSLATGRVGRNTITCDPNDNLAEVGIETFDARMVIDSNTVTDCWQAIRAQNTSYVATGTPLEIRGNTIMQWPGGYSGIRMYGNARLAGKVIGNTIIGSGVNGAIYLTTSQNPTLLQVDSNTITNALNSAIHPQYADTIRIRDNVILGGSFASGSSLPSQRAMISVQYPNIAADRLIEIRRNTIRDTRLSGINLARFAFGDTITIIVDSNHVHRADSMGVWIQGYSRARLTRNTIDSTGIAGVRIDRTANNEPTAVVINQNNFVTNLRYAAENLDGASATYNALDNWWNSASGPGTGGDSIFGFFDVSSFLTAPFPGAPLPAAPAPWSVSPPSLVGTAMSSLAPFRAVGVDAETRALDPRTQAARLRAERLDARADRAREHQARREALARVIADALSRRPPEVPR